MYVLCGSWESLTSMYVCGSWESLVCMYYVVVGSH